MNFFFSKDLFIYQVYYFILIVIQNSFQINLYRLSNFPKMKAIQLFIISVSLCIQITYGQSSEMVRHN